MFFEIKNIDKTYYLMDCHLFFYNNQLKNDFYIGFDMQNIKNFVDFEDFIVLSNKRFDFYIRTTKTGQKNYVFFWFFDIENIR